ncbi:DNA-binding protein [Kitasatospora sp. NPDC051853]|uniref:DNA-binding protein n=1 Tax=Kitasatospora sp. NPDC051853 TaxID=3364058 RepID=UPI0037ADDCCF
MSGTTTEDGATMSTGTTLTEAQAEELLLAGAVLPPGTEGAGRRAVPLTARTYHHPAVEGRVVVRLVPAELGAAEDLAAGYLGLAPQGEPAEVGLGMRQALGFPEWVLAHHPADGHHALGVMPELERIARQAKSKPKAALDAYQELAGRLAAAVPHFLPTFYEQAGRVFLGVENVTYASQMFTKARRAEAQHGLALDEERLDAVFLEFALAGALPVKVLSGYGKELTARVSAEEAFARFRELCVRRTAGGLQPSAQMATDLRRLARSAGLDPDTAEGEYLAELLELPATLRAAAGWWKGHRSALIALGRRDEAVRGRLLNLMPTGDDYELPGLWLEILSESGADAGLVDVSLPEAQRPADGSAGWFRRFTTWRNRGWYQVARIPVLHPLTERMAEVLRAELAGTGEVLPLLPSDVDLVDQLLSLELPLEEPKENTTLFLEAWAQQEEGRRDLLALAADERFHQAFRRGLDRISDDHEGRIALSVLAGSPGGRPLLAEWTATVARSSAAAGLPGLPSALSRLGWLPGEVLALAEEEVREAAAFDLGETLAKALRAGVMDELGWDAWDSATSELVPRKDVDEIIVADAWPYLIAAGPSQARVLGADGAVLTHDLRIPAGDSGGRDRGYLYTDGSLLVQWDSRANNHRSTGYWHTAADRTFAFGERTESRGMRTTWLGALRSHGLPLAGGGFTTGMGVVHVGDTALPGDRAIVSDGTSFWVWEDPGGTDPYTWFEYDPASNTTGRASLPAFLADAAKDDPAGSRRIGGWLLPTADAAEGPSSGPAGGLLGWRTVKLADGRYRGEDMAGRQVFLPEDAESPDALVVFPGAERPVAVVRGSYRAKLYQEDGSLLAEMRTDDVPGEFAEGTPLLPPMRYWHRLRPRDEAGSLALRAMDRETASALLRAAVAADGPRPGDLQVTLAVLLPQVTHPALRAGLAGVLRYAARQQAVLDQVTVRLTERLNGGPSTDAPTGPADVELSAALSGTGLLSRWWGRHATHYVSGQFAFLEAAARPESPALPAGTLHVDCPETPYKAVPWEQLPLLAEAAALRAATAPDGDQREAAAWFAGRLAGLGLTGSAPHWRKAVLELAGHHLLGPDGDHRGGGRDALLALGGGAFVLFADTRQLTDGSTVSTVLLHDPAGLFEVPSPYTVHSIGEVGTGGPEGVVAATLELAAERGPAPWRPAAAERFAELTGVTPTLAALVVAGLPQVDSHERNFLSAEARTALGLKVAEAAVARDELRAVATETRQHLIRALLPADPAALWEDGPDVEAVAAVWVQALGRRLAVPEALLADAVKGLRTSWTVGQALAAVLEPDAAEELAKDLDWTVRGDRCVPVESGASGFTANILTGALATAAWLAHRLPAGDPLRAALPAALAAVRARLAHPGLILDFGRYVSLPDFKKSAGAPTEVGEGYERYGAVIMATHDDRPAPGIRTALLDSAGQDPYLPVLRGDGGPFAAEVALRLAASADFAALLADPGAPAAGEAGADGTWWPQDPSRSVPELVAGVREAHGLGEDAAVLYLMLLAMPDPTDKNTARWTGWRPARLKAARAELAATDLVVTATRTRAGRSLFLPGAWTERRTPYLPLETWKLPLLGELAEEDVPLGTLVPGAPAAELYRRAWQRIQDGDLPRFEELKVKRAGRRR